MSILIRPATAADLPAITAIYGHAVTHGTATFETEPPGEAEMGERFRAIVTGGFPYLVACTEDGRTVGYAYAGLYRTRDRVPAHARGQHLHRSGVSPPRRRPRPARSPGDGIGGARFPPDGGGDRRFRANPLDRAPSRCRLPHGRHLRGGRLQVRPLARHGDDAARPRRRGARRCRNAGRCNRRKNLSSPPAGPSGRWRAARGRARGRGAR